MNEALQFNSPTAPAENPHSPQKQWFAVYTAYRQEQRVADHLRSLSIEHYLPTYRAQPRWIDLSKATSGLPLFPCYVFVHIGREQRVPVLAVPGVLWMVGDSGAQPTPLPQLEIDTLRATLDPSRVEPHPYLAAGPRVRIRAGALAGLEGVLVQRRNSMRVVISLELIMQSIAVEVSADDIEYLDPAAAPVDASTLHGPGKLAFCQL